MRRYWPLGLGVLALAAGLGYGLLKPQPLLLNNLLVDPPKPLPSVELISTQAQPFGPQDLRGQWSLLFSGYTNCPDVCPITLSLLTQWQQERGATPPSVRLLFATVDPKQDKLASLQAYLAYFDAQILGLTGTETELNRLLLGLGFYPVTRLATAATATPSKARLLSHSGAVAVINPQGELHALLRAPLTLELLQIQLEQILQGSEGFNG